MVEICQRHLTHELIMKAAINYFRQITTKHTNNVTTINSPNTISQLCAIIRTFDVPSPVKLLHLINGQTCEFCLVHPLDPLEIFFGVVACQTCLGYESEVNFTQLCDLKRRPFSSQRRTWYHQYLVTSVPHFCKFK